MKLGDLVVDRITGYEGVVVVISSHLDGTRNVGIQAAGLLGADRRPVDLYWIDEARADVKAGVE